MGPHTAQVLERFAALPECEWTSEGIYPQKVVDRFDEVLDRGTDALLEDLVLVTQANMETWANRFVTALRGDHLLVEDF